MIINFVIAKIKTSDSDKTLNVKLQLNFQKSSNADPISQLL